MNSLRNLQQACFRAFSNGDPALLLPMVRSGGVAPEQRVEVYRNNYREIYRKALAASFPVIHRLVGESCFAGLARAYTREHPSRCGDIQHFGTNFAAFLEHTYDDTGFRYLSSVADLEWALEEIHLEPDERPLAIVELQKFSADDYCNLVFRVRRAVRLVKSGFPIHAIWRANQPGNNDRVDLDRGRENVAVARQGDDLQLHLLDDDTFALAVELARGVRLEDAWTPDAGVSREIARHAAPDLGAALRTIMNLGLLADVAASDPPTVMS